MNVVISGASGFIGKTLMMYLKSNGHEPISISRSELLFENNRKLVEKINGADAIINLSGSSISKRWTKKNKVEIYQSRINTTRNIVEAIIKCEKRPSILINASAIGIYDDIHCHDEESKYLASTYLGKVVMDWERASRTALEYGVSVSILRFGIVLGKNGGILKKMLPLFRMGLGGKIGNGKQFFSFIHIDDLIQIINQILIRKLPQNTYNVVCPDENTNEDFTRKFADVLHVPAFLSIPSFAFNILYGEGATVFIGGQNAKPTRLIENGFHFKYPTLIQALENILKKTE